MKKVLDISCVAMITLSLLGVCMYENTSFWNFFYFARTDLFIILLLSFIYKRLYESPYILAGILCYVSYLVFDFGTLLGWCVFDFLLKLSLTLILTIILLHTLWHIYHKR